MNIESELNSRFRPDLRAFKSVFNRRLCFNSQFQPCFTLQIELSFNGYLFRNHILSILLSAAVWENVNNFPPSNYTGDYVQ